MVIDKELKAEIERRYNGWDDLCQQLNSAGARLETVKMQRDMVKEQLVTLKTEIKSIGEAIDDPRTDLTMTMSELILEYKQQLADINAAVMHESDVAESYRAEADNLRQQLADSQKQVTMLRDALDEAATSLETIKLRSHGDESYLNHMDQVRGYAGSRATVVREALAIQPNDSTPRKG